MATQIEILTVTAEAGADLSAATVYGKIVTMSSGQVVLCTGATDKPFGVVLVPAPTTATGAPVVVCRIGRVKVQGDANLAKGDSIGPSADGQAAAYTASDTTKYIMGDVIVDNAAAGGYCTADINCVGIRTLA